MLAALFLLPPGTIFPAATVNRLSFEGSLFTPKSVFRITRQKLGSKTYDFTQATINSLHLMNNFLRFDRIFNFGLVLYTTIMCFRSPQRRILDSQPETGQLG